MADGIRAYVKNEAAFTAAFQRKAKALGDMWRPMEQVLNLIRESILRGTIVRQVETEDVGQSPFKALTAKYAARKTKKYGAKPILVASGQMLKRQRFRTRVRQLKTKTVGRLKYTARGKIKIRALTHQQPITWPGPRRKWFGFRRGDRKGVTRIIGRRVHVAMRA